MNIEKLNKELDLLEAEDKKTKKFKFKNNKMNSLEKQSMKKPDYVLVQYLFMNGKMEFKLQKIISGNIIVVNNKGHKINPKDTFIHGKFKWYIVKEWDINPVSTRDYNQVKKANNSTDNHTVLIKMVLGAIQKKEMSDAAKKWIVYIIIGAVALFVVYILFFSGKH